MLKIIKLIHTLIWVLMASAIFYIIYAGIKKDYNIILWSSLGIILIEVLILSFNRWTCPLTPMARKYSDETKENFDIYLPLFLARHNKTIFGALFLLGLIILAFNALRLN